MSEPFLGEIKMTSFGYAPKGWALCNGQLLPINQNQALFSILGTTYGGNGTTNFALPDLRGRVPMHFFDTDFPLGQRGGEEQHTLSVSEIPAHTHTLFANPNTAINTEPGGQVLATATDLTYTTNPNNSVMATQSVTTAGNSQPHENMQPSLVINFVIALQGIYPSQS
ncbi:MAG: tail fiber protein [Nostoc sp. DedQUE12a]|nr:tail fiber protein [Nostoc sp. DedQUE12a]